MTKPVLLCILDGWGFADNQNEDNAIFQANTPNYDAILNNYPYSLLQTSGIDVGLPEGQMGNSEVGHANIGSGRIIYQDLVKINNAVIQNKLKDHQILKNLIKDLNNTDKTCHLIGMISDGGVHSHQDHLIYLAKLLANNNINVAIHAILDGRDTAQKSAVNYINNLQENIKNHQNIQIASLMGRYYAMDRDKRWDRIKLAYDGIILAQAPLFTNPTDAIKNSYENQITDEFLKPIINKDYQGINNEDAFIFTNFRADRARQISHALIDPNFKEFARPNIKFSHQIAATSYSKELEKHYQVLFKEEKITNSLGEILAKNNLTQLRIAETEKYAHVTFFFSAGAEQEFKGETRILIDSPKVATYDLAPEMSANQVTQKLIKAINSQKFDFIVVNFANPDMVGHSGKLKAAINACQVIDDALGQLQQAILQNNGSLLITADHGNIEQMHDTINNQPHTAHTTNPVPFILIDKQAKNIKLQNGRLSDIAPTILNILNITQPKEMTGKNLISKNV